MIPRTPKLHGSICLCSFNAARYALRDCVAPLPPACGLAAVGWPAVGWPAVLDGVSFLAPETDWSLASKRSLPATPRSTSRRRQYTSRRVLGGSACQHITFHAWINGYLVGCVSSQKPSPRFRFARSIQLSVCFRALFAATLWMGRVADSYRRRNEKSIVSSDVKVVTVTWQEPEHTSPYVRKRRRLGIRTVRARCEPRDGIWPTRAERPE